MWRAGSRWRLALSLAGTALLVACGGTTRSAPDDSPNDVPRGCSYGGKSYQVGDAFLSTDGCNSCSCAADGTVGCTEKACAPEPGPACKVNGVVYPDGASNIPDPVSCNSCVCQAGQLACDDQLCPKPCPTGTLFARGCAKCGPTDACLVVESACMPICTDSCDAGLCDRGICISVCG